MFYSNAWILGLLLTVSACGGTNIEYVYVTTPAETGGDSTVLETPSTDGDATALETTPPTADAGVPTDAQVSSSTATTVATNADAGADAQAPSADSSPLAADAANTETEAAAPCTISAPMVCYTPESGDLQFAYPAGCVLPMSQVCEENQPWECRTVVTYKSDGGVQSVGEYCPHVLIYRLDDAGRTSASSCSAVDYIPAGTACGRSGVVDLGRTDAGVMYMYFTPRDPIPNY